jgi:hypothetical protein
MTSKQGWSQLNIAEGKNGLMAASKEADLKNDIGRQTSNSTFNAMLIPSDDGDGLCFFFCTTI